MRYLRRHKQQHVRGCFKCMNVCAYRSARRLGAPRGARRALRGGSPSRLRACEASTPAVLPEFPASTLYRSLRRRREPIDILDIYRGHLFTGIYTRRPGRSVRKSSGYKRRLRRVVRRRELFLRRGSARRVGGARMRRFCRRCLHGSPCTGVGTREYPSRSTRRGTLVVCRTPHAVVWTGT